MQREMGSTDRSRSGDYDDDTSSEYSSSSSGPRTPLLDGHEACDTSLFNENHESLGSLVALTAAALEKYEREKNRDITRMLGNYMDHVSIAKKEEQLTVLSDTDHGFPGDLNRHLEVRMPTGQVASSVVCPFDDKVHYSPRTNLSEMSSEDLSESDLVFSQDFAELSFICRVLAMALDPSVLLLDRFKFLCLVSQNLDEHFSKRLGNIANLDPDDLEMFTHTMRRQVRPKTRYEEELTIALRTIVEKQHQCLRDDLLPALKIHGVEIVKYSYLNAEQKRNMTEYFNKRFRSLLTPIVVDQTHPFPLLHSHDIYLVVVLVKPDVDVERKVLLRVPTGHRLLSIDASKKKFVTAEDVCLANLGLICRGMTVRKAFPFRVTRNIKMTIEDETFGEIESLLDYVVDECHRRRGAPATRLEVLEDTPSEVVQMFTHELGLDDSDVYEVSSPLLDLRTCISLAFIPPLPQLRDTVKDPVVPAPFKGLFDRLHMRPRAIFDVIRKKDILVDYPKESYESSAILFMHAAARDPKVRTIKTALYRSGTSSPMVAALVRAAKNGKEVTVLVELKASFDEVQNSEYARDLQLAGCNVVYGLVGLKVHSKAIIAVREEDDGSLLSYSNISTGNYNPTTAKLYTDFSLYTCREEVCTEIHDVFNSLTGYSRKEDYQCLLVAPVNMLERFLELIRTEAQNAREGKPARIACQMNGLTDKAIVKELYEASQAGVKIDLIVRGACRLRPEIPGKSDNIRVYSWLGPHLQHRRLFYFHNAGHGKYYIGSADWRTRNLHDRVEVVVPIENKVICKRLAKAFDLVEDVRNVWRMSWDGRYYKGLPSPRSPKISAKIAPRLMRGGKQKGVQRQQPASGMALPRGHFRNIPFEPAVIEVSRPPLDLAPTIVDTAQSNEGPSSRDAIRAGLPKRPKSRRRIQVNIKGDQNDVNKISVGAVPIQFTGGVDSMSTLEVLVVARADGTDTWSVPKGGLNEGESAKEGTIRVAREKAGVLVCEEIANIGWVLRRKKNKLIAVQTYVLQVHEVGRLSSSSQDRIRQWMPFDEAMADARKNGSDFAFDALRLAGDALRSKFETSADAINTSTGISIRSESSSSLPREPMSPPKSSSLEMD